MMPFFAPKGQKNLDQGFNPGLTGPTAYALKVALEGFVSPDARGLSVYASFPIWCPFLPSLANAELRRTGRAHGVKTLTPGLKPRLRKAFSLRQGYGGQDVAARYVAILYHKARARRSVAKEAWAKFCCPFGAGLRPFIGAHARLSQTFPLFLEYLNAYGERLTVNY